jgi:hypothetical protein
LTGADRAEYAVRPPHASQVDEDGSKEIEFQEFIHAIQINKAMSEKNSNETETVDAFVALGGNVSVLRSLAPSM